MKALLEIDTEQAEGAVTARLGNAPHTVACRGILHELSGLVEAQILDELGGATAQTLGEGILQGPA